MGCWGPIVQCNIAERGIVDGHGGCMNMGGICIGCTMPGFPDKFSPIYERPPGALLSTNTNRVMGGFIRRMRQLSQTDKMRSARWHDSRDLPSGWGRYKRLAGIWDDICDFFLEANPAYSDVGLRPSNLIQTGIWDDLEVYDATYANIDAWGQARYSAPGIIKEGELLTTKLTEINMGIEEFVEHSYYDDWTTNSNGNGHMRFPTDALGNPLSPYHAWNKETIPRPEGKNFKDKYSWSTAPRWDRTSMETGVYGRMWTTAMAQQFPDNPYIEATGDGLRMLLPAHDLPETELFWKVPAKLNAFERNRGRAYGVAFTAAIGMICLMQAFEYWRKGETRVSTPFKVPRDERGVSRLLGGRAGLPDPPHAHGQGTAAQLPDQHAVHLERLTAGSVRQSRALRAGHHGNADPRSTATPCGPVSARRPTPRRGCSWWAWATSSTATTGLASRWPGG